MKNTKEWNITDEMKNYIEQMLTSSVFFSSPSRRKVKGSITEWDTGDLIIRTDIEELKTLLDDKLMNDGLNMLEINQLQDEYQVPQVIGGMWKIDNWNVYKDDLNKPHDERGRYEYEDDGEPTTKTKDDVRFTKLDPTIGGRI